MSKSIPGECPEPDALGQAGWTILHTAAAVFPYRPSEAQKEGMARLIEGWSQVYACSHCAYHMRQHVAKHPPRDTIKGKEEASWYVCDMHNKVNKVLGKEEYDCSPATVLRRWHPSYPNMEDTPTIEDQIEQIRREEREEKMKKKQQQQSGLGVGGGSGGFSGQQQQQQNASSATGGSGGGGFFSSWFGGGKSAAAAAAAPPAAAPVEEAVPGAAPQAPVTARNQTVGGREVPLGANSRISQSELSADPRTQTRWGDKPVFDATAPIGQGAVRSGWSTSGPNPHQSTFAGSAPNSTTTAAAAPTASAATAGPYGGPALRTVAPLVPPLSAADRAAAAAADRAAAAAPIAPATDAANEGDISEIMKKVRGCAVYCPEKDKAAAALKGN